MAHHLRCQGGRAGTQPTARYVWAHESDSGTKLQAYDATNLANELYNSTQAANNRDFICSTSTKFTTPVVTGGKVFVASGTGVAIFGLLN